MSLGVFKTESFRSLKSHYFICRNHTQFCVDKCVNIISYFNVFNKHIHTHTHTHTHIYIYIYMLVCERERESVYVWVCNLPMTTYTNSSERTSLFYRP